MMATDKNALLGLRVAPAGVAQGLQNVLKESCLECQLRYNSSLRLKEGLRFCALKTIIN